VFGGVSPAVKVILHCQELSSQMIVEELKMIDVPEPECKTCWKL